MKISYFIFTLFVVNSLFAENNNIELIRHNPIDISLMDTSELDPKLKLFLDKYYQKNYPTNKSLKNIKSIQFLGKYTENGKEVGSIKLIKKRPNKYKSHLKKKDGTEEIFAFNGKNLYKLKSKGTNILDDWQKLDTNSLKNLWIHYDQIFDSPMLYPNKSNKRISIGKAFVENGQVIQPINIVIKNKIKITNLVSIRDNLVKKAFVEIYSENKMSSDRYTIFYEDYELIKGILLPKKITTKYSDNSTICINYSEIQINLGISDFFFEAISL